MRFKLSLLLSISLASSLLLAGDENAKTILNKNSSAGSYDVSGIAKDSKNMTPQSLTKTFVDANATAKKYGIDSEFVKKINKVNSVEAKKASADFYSNKQQQNIAGMKEYILNDETFKYKGLQADQIKKSNQSGVALKAKNSVFPTAVANENVGLSANERIYIFVSSSMPDELVKTYLGYAEKSNGAIRLALRGFVKGPEKIGPTQDWVRRMITKKDGTEYKAGIEINPQIQAEYGINQVPAVLYIADYNPINDAHTGQFKKSDDFWVVYGGVDFIYALEQIQKDSKAKGFTKLIKTLRGDFYK